MRSPCSKRIAVLLVAAVLGGAAAACSDDPVQPRADVEGLFIRQSQTVMVEVTADGGAVGALDVEEGETSEVFFIVFTDADGLPLEMEDDEFVILRDFDDTIVSVEQVSPGSPGFQLVGLQGGQTSLVVELARGDPSDPDAATSVYVTPDEIFVGVAGLV